MKGDEDTRDYLLIAWHQEGIVQRDPRVAEVAVVGKRTYESTRDDADVAEDREDGKLTLIIAVVVTPLYPSV